jgi:hypothetical protein
MKKTDDPPLEPLERTMSDDLYEEIKSLWLVHVTMRRTSSCPTPPRRASARSSRA